MAGGLNKRRMIQHAVFQELCKVCNSLAFFYFSYFGRKVSHCKGVLLITLANIRHFINFKMLYHLKFNVVYLFFSVCLFCLFVWGFFFKSKAFQKLLVGTKENCNDDGDKIVNYETKALHVHFITLYILYPSLVKEQGEFVCLPVTVSGSKVIKPSSSLE